MTFHILTTTLPLLQLIADSIDRGEGYPRPGGSTLHHALPETRHDGAEYALLADDIAAKYIGALVGAVTGIPAGPFAGESVRIAEKAAEWTPPDVMGA